jgi:hypothetical protein
VLRWSVIPRTLSVAHVVGTPRVNGDAATVLTSRRWERMMSCPDGSGADRPWPRRSSGETWRRIPNGWFACDTAELGGDIFINGEPYTPCPDAVEKAAPKRRHPRT